MKKAEEDKQRALKELNSKKDDDRNKAVKEMEELQRKLAAEQVK